MNIEELVKKTSEYKEAKGYLESLLEMRGGNGGFTIIHDNSFGSFPIEKAFIMEALDAEYKKQMDLISSLAKELNIVE